MRPRSLVLCLLLTLLALPAVAPRARAQELVAPKTTDRKFPQGVFCPLPFDLSFTANGSDALLRFSTETVNYFDTNSSQNEWSHQWLDDICVVTDDDFKTHQVVLGTYASDCYIGARIDSTLGFNQVASPPVKDQFQTDPALAGWDLSHDAYWETVGSAPDDPANGPTSTGSLGLGAFDPTLSLTDSAFTTRHVTGLTPGVKYHVTGWWNVNQMQLDKIFLTVAVLGDGGTATDRKTWGGVKLRYR